MDNALLQKLVPQYAGEQSQPQVCLVRLWLCGGDCGQAIFVHPAGSTLGCLLARSRSDDRQTVSTLLLCRFDRELVFPLPNLQARASILDIHTRKWSQPPEQELKQELANRCVGYCGADLKVTVVSPALLAFTCLHRSGGIWGI